MAAFRVIRSERHFVAYVIEAESSDAIYFNEEDWIEDAEPVEDDIMGADIIDVIELIDGVPVDLAKGVESEVVAGGAVVRRG